MSSKTLQGKLAIVTGASKQSGIGFATAHALAELGANIVLHYNSNKEAALKSAHIIKHLGVEVVTVQADATSLSFGKDIVDATLKAFPGKTIDIIVNNAGAISGYPSLKEVPAEDFDTIFHINVRSVFLLIQAAEEHLTAPGARIVNVGSLISRMGSSAANSYAGSKAAINVMSRGWSEELAPRGITVNVASFGPIATDMVLPDDHPLVNSFRINGHIKRNGTVKEAANAIVFLASPNSSYITGQVINVDGGIIYT